MTVAARRRPKPRRRRLHEKHVVHGREWDRGTELLTLFAMTGWGILTVGRENSEARPRPQSIVLVGPPGSGKTEMLMRFRGNRPMEFRSDLTVRGLWRILLYADKGRVTHVVLPEFNKTFQRKLSTAMNCMGTLTEAMDEGVWDAEVGPQRWAFNGARVGILGGMTGRTLNKRRAMLYEMGFLDRCAMLPWALPDEQRRDILRRIAHGDKADVARVVLPIPGKPVHVKMPVAVGDALAKYTWDQWPDEALRMMNRFRALVMAAAMLDGRESCRPVDIERAVFQFRDYWDRLVLSESVEDSAPTGGDG